MSIFHLAYHVDDLARARACYGGLLGCTEGRSTETWVDFNFFGHQISLHLGPVGLTEQPGQQNTMSFHDPAGNPIEINELSDMAGVFTQ